jgi:hypothetical protein
VGPVARQKHMRRQIFAAALLLCALSIATAQGSADPFADLPKWVGSATKVQIQFRDYKTPAPVTLTKSEQSEFAALLSSSKKTSQKIVVEKSEALRGAAAQLEVDGKPLEIAFAFTPHESMCRAEGQIASLDNISDIHAFLKKVHSRVPVPTVTPETLSEQIGKADSVFLVLPGAATGVTLSIEQQAEFAKILAGTKLAQDLVRVKGAEPRFVNMVVRGEDNFDTQFQVVEGLVRLQFQKGVSVSNLPEIYAFIRRLQLPPAIG